jgi:hypothetical protein
MVEYSTHPRYFLHARGITYLWGMAICPRGQEDLLVWVGTKNGIYSVRSKYHLATELVERGSSACSSNNLNRELWKQVWNVRGPSVVQLFLWKTCHNILLTREKLHRRGILSDPLCPIYGLEMESLWHTL